jgi:hypothetical protein
MDILGGNLRDILGGNLRGILAGNLRGIMYSASGRSDYWNPPEIA